MNGMPITSINMEIGNFGAEDTMWIQRGRMQKR